MGFTLKHLGFGEVEEATGRILQHNESADMSQVRRRGHKGEAPGQGPCRALWKSLRQQLYSESNYIRQAIEHIFAATGLERLTSEGYMDT